MQVIDGRLFTGGMDKDADPSVVEINDYIDAVDVLNGYGASVGALVFPKGSNNLTFAMPSGTNLCVKAVEDKFNACLIMFFYNSSGNHQILRYSALTETITVLAKGSALGFSNTRRIAHAEIVDGRLLYWTDVAQDSRTVSISGNPPYMLDMQRANPEKQFTYEVYAGLPGEGQFANGSTYKFQKTDINGTNVGPEYTITSDGTYHNHPKGGLAWLADQITALMGSVVTVSECDGCKITIKVIANSQRLKLTASVSDVLLVGINNYPLTLQQYHIDLLKQPAHCAPHAEYLADPLFKQNNVENLCAQFIVRYVYYNNEKSAWSPVSNIPLNVGADGSTLTSLNSIQVDFSDDRLKDPSWLSMIRFVEIGFRDGNQNYYKFIEQIPVCEIGILRQRMIFYNDKPYTTIESDENSDSDVQALKPYDHLPVLSGALTVSADQSGNALMFLGSNLEGYDCPDCVDFKVEAIEYSDECLLNITGTVQIINDAAYPSAHPDFERYALNGFVVYLAGTNYYAISNNPSDGTGDGKFTIKGVPRGKYLLRVASFKVGPGGDYSARYDFSNGLEWQRTSAPVIQFVVPAPAPVIIGGYALYNIVQEIEIDLSTFVGTTYDLAVQNAPGIIKIQNQHWSKRDESFGPALVEAYFLDNNATDTSRNDRVGALNVERQIATWGLYDSGANTVTPFEGYFLDHNGYFWKKVTKAVTPNDVFWIGDPTDFFNTNVYRGDYKAMYEDTLTVISPLSIAGINYYLISGVYTVFFLNKENPITQRKRLLEFSNIDANTMPASGVINFYGRTTRFGVSDAQGVVQFVAYIPWGYPAAPTTRSDDSAYGLYLNDICYQFYPALNPKPVTIDNALPGPVSVPQFVFGWKGGIVRSERFFKGGGVYEWALVYEDRGNRSCGAVKGYTMKVPYHPAPNGIVPWRAKFTINSTPPLWATHYRLARTLNSIQKNYVQWSVKSVIYAKITSPLEPPIITSFANGDATHLFLELYVPKQIDLTTTYYLPFYNENGQYSYTPQPGDKVRLILDEKGKSVSTDDNYYEAAVIGKYVDATGEKIYASVENVFGTLEVKAYFLAEYYVPASNAEIYYEGGEDCYEIINPGLSNRYHAGPIQNQTASQPALGMITGGDTYFRRDPATNTAAVPTEHVVPRTFMDASVPCQDIGRAFAAATDKAQLFFYNRIRMSGTYRSSSLINGLSSYRGTDYLDINRQWGILMYLGISDNVMLAVCQFRVQPVYINKQQLMTLDGDTSVGRSTRVLVIANESVMPYGTMNPESVIIENGYLYAWDKYRGVVWRYASNGIEPIVYKMVKYFRQKGKERIVGNDFVVAGYARRYNMFLLTFYPNGEVYPYVTLGFDETENRWKSRYSFIPDAYGSVGNDLIAMKGNRIDIMFENTNRANYFGVQYKPQIQFPFNKEFRAVKIWYKMRILSNNKWEMPVITTPANFDYASGQLSRLKANHVKPYEGIWWAEFLRDMNDTSAEFLNIPDPVIRKATALLNGRRLRGQILTVTMQAVDGSLDTVLISVDAYYDYSGKTNP